MNKISLRLCILAAFFINLLPAIQISAQQTNNSMAELNALFDSIDKIPCGQRGKAIRAGKMIVEYYDGAPKTKEFVEFLKNDIAKYEKAKSICLKGKSLEIIYGDFLKLRKSTLCEDEAVSLDVGKEILERFGEDELNQKVIEFVRKQIPKIEEQARTCRRNEIYNYTYKSKIWNQFFATSKQVIDEEGDSPISLDVMLTLVSVGQRLTTYEENDTYNSDTVFYAKRAIELIESGVETQSRWGTFEPYESKEKALGWLNYTIGYISYFRLKEGKKAIPFFYQATRYNMEFKYDAFMYHAVAIYYFDKNASMASSLEINDFVNKASSGYSPINEVSNKNELVENEVAELYTQLLKLYNLRYNLKENESVFSLAQYIQKLIERPLIDPSADIKQKPRK